jgi:protein KRI1
VEAKLGKTTSLGKRARDEGQDSSCDTDESTSDSEEEDEGGVLITKTLDSEILATLNAIRSKDPRVYDSNAAFYSEFKDETDTSQPGKKEKPMYLQDYHRKNLLSGQNIGENE